LLLDLSISGLPVLLDMREAHVPQFAKPNSQQPEFIVKERFQQHMSENETAPIPSATAASAAAETSPAETPTAETAPTENAPADRANAETAATETAPATTPPDQAAGEKPPPEEISYHAVEKDGQVAAIWEMQGRKHVRTIDPRSRQGQEILRLYTSDHHEETPAVEASDAATT
jgi:hypothetical protein